MIKSNQFITDEIRRAAEKEALANLMSVFSEEVFEKIMKKFDSGYRGWDQNENIEKLKERLANNINNNDWIDVAAVSMFLWNIEQPDKPELEITKPPTQ